MSDLIYLEDAKDFVRHALANGLNVIDYLDKIPAADAAPAVHGEWVQTSTYHLRHGDGIVSEAYCSVCEMYSYQLSTFPYVGYDYCPRCGAKMDGGDHDG